ncbi:MAG: exodeoxyribonuclease VII large subunit [Lachnospiraceae bacterium]|nr:exodeoxyribonuclease VII large subunit [Lachnospiraceae bacterium]MBQ2105507.1 exodeoxyribonuclease VII large subunit [Lachnospiraceae bacterium]MBQ2250137.1 exodeoxyribonuclease VII large subunit [Lachnospiraceae bacterium]MBQ2404023.1 exodeoxyribonuclease VII large subunit [Lachnospiraceae bacterium]MBQ2425691.1 exodeoxyribonuclease VII large subunit [Lachnospiraceae bacterium]
MAGVYSVTQVNSYIKNMFSQDFLLRRLSVKGEVSNCKYHTSGHIYFTLKDRGGTLAAVMFAGQRRGLQFRLEEGQQVVVKGTVDVYERDGKYQLYAQEIELAGRGDLYVKFEKLLRELEEMGMFDAQYKRPIPKYAKRVGIVTAPTGAAVRDIINISKRRNPYVQLVLYPALVQGEGAKDSIVHGIQTLDAMGLDVLIVGRGGGSIEDLWAFNEEAVARAIFACETPVISAVGHETDVTIADYVADLRAPTPSAAAELAVFDHGQFLADLEARKRKLDREMGFFLDSVKGRLKRDELKIRIHHPQRIINEKRQRLADIEDVMNRRLGKMLDDSRRGVTMKADTLERIMERRLEQDKKRLALASGKLWGLSPLKKLGQGYGFVTDESGARLASVKQAPVGSKIHVQVADGKLTASVEKSEEAESRRG